MQNTSVAKFLTRRYYYEDARVELMSRKQGVVKKKKESSMMIGKNPGSYKMYFRFHKKGKVLAYYEDCPPKTGSRPMQVICVQEIKDLTTSAKGKDSHFKLFLPDEALELKLDEQEDLAEWVKCINFFRDYYSKEKPLFPQSYKKELNKEFLLQLMAENELADWETIKGRYDFTIFFKETAIIQIFKVHPHPILANRILVSTLHWKFKTSNLKPKEPENFSIRKNVKAVFEQLNSKGTPKTVDEFKEAFGGNEDRSGTEVNNVFLISQRPLFEIDEEQTFKDYKAISKEGLPPNIDFNVMYFFDGNIIDGKRSVKKALPVKYVNKRH